MSKANFIHIQPALKQFQGHYFDYVNRLCQNLDKTKYDFRVYGSKKASAEVATKLTHFIPFFSEIESSGAGKRSGATHPFLRANRFVRFMRFVVLSLIFMMDGIRFAWAVKKGINANDSKTVFFVESFSGVRLWGMALMIWLIGWRKWKKGVHFLIILRHSYETKGRFMRALDQAILVNLLFKRLIRKPNCKVSLLTDSFLLKTELENFFKQSVTVVPIPAFEVADITLTGKWLNESVKTVTFLGDGTHGRGDFLVSLLVNSENIAMAGIELCLRSNLISDISIQQNNKKVKIRFVSPNLTTAEFDSVIAASSVILLPYENKQYMRGTSGIFAQSLGMNCVPIVSPNTWMAYELMKLDLGSLVLASNEYEELECKILDVAKNYDIYQKQIQVVSDKWRSYHNGKELAAVIQKLIDGESYLCHL